mgnify:CR=1 FL=1
MIQAELPSTRPITVEEVAEFIGTADASNPILRVILERVIRDIEKALGIGIGVAQVTLTLFPPKIDMLGGTSMWLPPDCLVMLPYSPVSSITAIYAVDPVSLEETELDLSDFVLWQKVPAELRMKAPLSGGLKVVYSGGFINEIPQEVRFAVLQNCAARFENRALDTLVGVTPITHPSYLFAWQ